MADLNPILDDAPATGQARQGWLTVLAGAIGVATGITALPFYTAGIFIGPLSHAFGWSRAGISSAVLINTATTALMVPLMGRAADRFGARPVALVSILAFGLAYFGYLLVGGQIWSFYLAGIVLSAAGAGTAVPLWTRGVSSWFDRRRGLAIGLTLLGSGLASILAPAYVGKMIELYGWRGGFAGLAAAPLLLGAPIVFLFYREAPTPVRAAGLAPEVGGASFGQVVRAARFWRMGVAVFLAATALSAFIVHFVPMTVGFGVARPTAVAMASEMGLAVVLGRLITGVLLDRLPVTVVGGGCFLLCAAANLYLSLGVPSPLALQVVILVAGLSAGAEIDFFTYSASRYFGLRSYSQVCGWLFSFFAVGGGLGPILAGLIYDRSGGYGWSLRLAAMALVGAAALFATLGPYSVQAPGPAEA